ncbi:MAG: MinD/ParA family protein [Oscillochloris sp.]|nr:MinD/ParA family protein [Oscillochloris sp.]
MTSITVIHSFRRGTGKSTVAANLAVLLADGGRRVGLVDASLQSPSLHLFFGLRDLGRRPTLNDYLAGRCELGMAALDVTGQIDPPPPGAVVLVPASGEADKILESLRGSYRAEALSEGLAGLADGLGLDALLVDTPAGLSEETLLTIAAADRVLLLLRPDHQDYHGTGVVIELARRLGAPQLQLLVNEVPPSFDAVEVALRVAVGFEHSVAAALHHSEQIQLIGSGGLLVRRAPDSPAARALRQIAEELC